MKIALIGYGKMGKAIETIALNKGHEIVLKIDIQNSQDFTEAALQKADVAIEFTGPYSAYENVKKCITWGIPVVSGSTGWLDQWIEIKDLCEVKNGTLIYSSNYSIGVNLFFELNKQLAQLMQPYNSYDVSMTEVHHTEKKDAPSGTAISLAEQILTHLDRKNKWVNGTSANANELVIQSERMDPAPGTHMVKYSSEVDDIEIIHTAHTRVGFASGAVLAAEFAFEKKGIFTMKDVLGL
ncbi:MAG: 4-hydroxy-tetrahydrodipicolinate reductase [Sediminibacterium sp.]|jgi:4-hydroxy-tetrahydrodipicolinate reductase|nr:4-hydroxy-tetrahydrodipicolinate reductase [Sediminibacterium sp.]